MMKVTPSSPFISFIKFVFDGLFFLRLFLKWGIIYFYVSSKLQALSALNSSAFLFWPIAIITMDNIPVKTGVCDEEKNVQASQTQK